MYHRKACLFETINKENVKLWKCSFICAIETCVTFAIGLVKEVVFNIFGVLLV